MKYLYAIFFISKIFIVFYCIKMSHKGEEKCEEQTLTLW